MVSLREDLDWLERYLGIMGKRYEQRFRAGISVPDSMGRLQVPKLFLQPFVENAIIHGLKELEGGGMLRVSFATSESTQAGAAFLHITIEDNGAGMPRDLAHKFNDRAWAVGESGNSIGLHNAFSRMHMYYGERAAWKVTGMEGMGTVVMLRIPADRRVSGADTDRRG